MISSAMLHVQGPITSCSHCDGHDAVTVHCFGDAHARDGKLNSSPSSAQTSTAVPWQASKMNMHNV